MKKFIAGFALALLVGVLLTPAIALLPGADPSDAPYGAGWNGSILAPTQNSVYDKLETLAGGHDAVTLNANITTELLATLGAGQELSLATQAANSVFAGPTTGAAAAPTFRALVEADIPGVEVAATNLFKLPTDPGAHTILGFDNTTNTYKNFTIGTGIDFTQATSTLSVALPTAASLHLDDVITLTGVAAEAVNLGIFTGSTIADNLTIKAALQSMETALELKQTGDATLTALAGLTITEGSIIYGTGADAFSVLAKGTGGYWLRMNAGATAPEWVDASTVYQPLDADLTALAAISGSRGHIAYYGASGWTGLPKGTSGYVLTMGANDPAWAASTGSGDLKADGTVPLTADWDVGNFDIEAKSFTTKKASGTAGQGLLYSSHTTDVTGAGWQGPTSASGMADSYFLVLPEAEPTLGQVLMGGTPSSHVSTMTWGLPATGLLTGWTSGAGTVAGTDTILAGMQKLDGNIGTKQGTLTNSAGLAGALSDETGSGLAVFNSAPIISQPKIVITTTGLTADTVYYLASNGTWTAADANGTGTYPARCYAISTTQCMTSGVYTKTTHGFTVGANLYLSDTPGTMSNTASTTTVQSLGWALDANTLVFSIGADYAQP